MENSYATDVETVLDLVNKERKEHNLDPLKLDPDLIEASDIRAMESVKTVSHTRPDGRPFYTVSDKVNGENLAAGLDTAEEVVDAWMNSPDHRKNILNPRFHTLGVAHLKADTKYKDYWVQLFGINKQTITLKKISGVKVTSKAKSVTLSWKPQTNSYATGYEVYIYDSGTKKYKLLKKLVGNLKNALVIKGLKSSKTYKCKILSYKTVNHKNYYTPSSKITIKT